MRLRLNMTIISHRGKDCIKRHVTHNVMIADEGDMKEELEILDPNG
jgi:hypothetical protein